MKRAGYITKLILSALLQEVLTATPRTSRGAWRSMRGLSFGGTKPFKSVSPEMVRRRFYHLKSARLISWREQRDGTVLFTLTEEGRKKALRYKLDEMTIKKPVKWDGKWRLIIFDIPEAERYARDALREKLYDLGCVQLQKSAWICPFPCEDEVVFVGQMFGVARHIVFAEAKIRNDRALRARFKLP